MLKIYTLFLFLSIAFASFIHAQNQVYVLCYHTFLGKPKINTDFSIQELRAHIQFFKANGFKFVQFSDILSNHISGKKNILITIDDGNISTLKAYQEVLKPEKIRPLLAIYPGIIDTRKFALKWSDLNVMKADGCEIACHGYFHEYLTEKFAQTHPIDFNDEFFKSKTLLETHLSQPIRWFVYPFGITSNVALKTLSQAKYQYAFTIVSRPLKLPLVDQPLLLPRYMLTRESVHRVFKNMVTQCL